MARLTNKIAVITGAAQGIGHAIALRFAEEGATLVLLDVDAERLAQTKAAVAALTGAPLTIVGDVTDEALVEDAFAKLSPGMAVTVEIKTGSRHIIEYLLSPLLRHKQQALREM